VGSGPLHRRLDWDSSFWGLEVAALDVGSTEPDAVAMDLRAADAWCEDRGVDVAFLRVPGTAIGALTPAVRDGFDLLEITTVLRARPGAGDWERGRIRAGTSADNVELGEIAATSFRPWGRFYADPRLRHRADELYRTWTVNSLHGYADFVLVSDDDGPSGFVTGHLDDGVGRLGLLGVAPAPPWARLGVVTRLLRSVLDRFGADGVSRVLLETQSHNRPMQAVLTSSGCTLDSVSACLHKWYR